MERGIDFRVNEEEPKVAYRKTAKVKDSEGMRDENWHSETLEK